MTTTDKVRTFWEEFRSANPEVGDDVTYQVWHFGNSPQMARELAELVIAGTKTATSSLAELNEMKPEIAPVPNGYSVVTDIEGEPMCVIQTTETTNIPFNEVDPQFAFEEGEGDQSLDFWRSAHADYFAREAFENGFHFNERTVICCERFRLLFPG
jgi:uncharacterized protein YhfF